MQNQVKIKLPNSAIVFQAVDGKRRGANLGVHAHEVDSGSFMFNALQKQWQENPDKTLADVFSRIHQEVLREAKHNERIQVPRMIIHGDPSAGEQRLGKTFLGLQKVLVLAPDYDERVESLNLKPLIGAQRDVDEMLHQACLGKIFSPGCQITAMSALFPTLFQRQGLSMIWTSQADAKKELVKIMTGDENVGVFIMSHGALDEVKQDEYLVFPESQFSTESRIYNMDLARMLVSKKKGFTFLFADYCFSHDFERDIERALRETQAVQERQALVVARGPSSRSYNPGRSHNSLVREQILEKAEQTVSEFALLRLAGNSIGAMHPAVNAQVNRALSSFEERAIRQMYPDGEHEGMTGYSRASLPPLSSFDLSSIGSASVEGYEPSAPFDEQAPFGASQVQFVEDGIQTDASPAPTISVAQVMTPATGVPVEGVQAPPAAGQVRDRALGEAVEALTSFWHDLPNQISLGWDMVEAASGYLFGTGILSYVLPWLIVAILVTTGAALWLYVRYIAHHQQGTFVTMVLVMAVTSMLPYLCDPILLQKFFSAENSVYVGLACTAASFVVLVITVAFNWRKISSNVSAVFKATSLASKYGMIARLALEMHLFDAGRSVQQTVHIRVAGIDRFVMYYPLMTNGTHPICPVRLTNDMVKHLPSGTGFTVLNKKLGENQWADITCMGSVMKRQVLNHTGGDIETIKSLSFDHGKHVLDLEGLHMDAKYLMNRFRVNTTGWDDHPVLSKVALAEQLPDAWKNNASFAIPLPTLTKKSKATTVELLAEPFLFTIEKLVGISLSALRVPRSSEL